MSQGMLWKRWSEDTQLETQNYKVFSNVVYHYLCKKCGKFADREAGSNDYPHQCGIKSWQKFVEMQKPPQKKLVWVYYTRRRKELKSWKTWTGEKFRTQELRLDWENWELVN